MSKARALKLPNFFLAGAPKAGTSSLYYYLAQHPMVFMSPVKEPTFFAAADLLSDPFRNQFLDYMNRNRAALLAYLEGRQPRGVWFWVLEWESYLKLFRDVRDEVAIGEASVGYFWAPSAAGAIRSKVPGARLIFILRDPVERLFSWYLLALWRAPQLTFRAWLRTTIDRPEVWWTVVEGGRYATHLRRFLGHFPRAQMRIYLYEDYRADPHSVLGDIFGFLGVNPDHPIDMSIRHNETVGPRFLLLHRVRRRILGDASVTRWLPEGARRMLRRLYHRRRGRFAMDPEDRRLMIDYYRDEIVRTGDLIGRDLSAWLRV